MVEPAAESYVEGVMEWMILVWNEVRMEWMIPFGLK